MSDKKMRRVHDTMGEMEIAPGKIWGAQTQRSVQNFPIGTEIMPLEQIYALAKIKAAAARVNLRLGKLDEVRAEAIRRAAAEVIEGRHDAQFPLSVWQTGSGTQSNMNVNEVLAYLAGEAAGLSVHPNDHVNCSQSSNDTFPTAMHLAAAKSLREGVLPAVAEMRAAFVSLTERYGSLPKLGRTHLQDAVPLRFGEELSAYIDLLDKAERDIKTAEEGLRFELPIGGTAVGTKLNAPEGFSEEMAALLSETDGVLYKASANCFSGLSAKHEMVSAHAALATLAMDMMKMSNDLRWLASGPRSGLGELRLPANEPGSSIMPGKVNPTQCEALCMVALRVLGNHQSLLVAESQGNFQLNVYMPLMIYSFLQSARLLADALRSFSERCLAGLEPDEAAMREKLERSLMLVTALSPRLGYEEAARIAKQAHHRGLSLLEILEEEKKMTAEEYYAALEEAFGLPFGPPASERSVVSRDEAEI